MVETLLPHTRVSSDSLEWGRSPLLSHDKLDACAAALLGAAGDGRIRDISVVAVGDSVFWDDVTGCLREGQIVVPNVDSALRVELQTVVQRWELAAVANHVEA